LSFHNRSKNAVADGVAGQCCASAGNAIALPVDRRYRLELSRKAVLAVLRLARCDKSEDYAMRMKLLGVLVSCGIVATAIAPAMACQYQTNASTQQQQPEQTAQAQTDSRSR
jgi:hypothetical protein